MSIEDSLAAQQHERLRGKIMGFLVSRSIAAICELGIPDQLANGPVPVSRLATSVGADPEALGRFLRVLVGEELFEEVVPDTFGLTPLGALLRTDAHGSQREFVELMGSEAYIVWEAAGYALRTGTAAFRHVYGQPYFDWLTAHPEAAERFDRGQAGLVERRLLPLLTYDWSGVDSVVDVGGGNGTLLGRVLSAQPRLTGTVFDLPHVVAVTAPLLTDADLTGRVSIVGGDFFDKVPPGADAYILSEILHDWPDHDAVRILEAVREAMRPDSRLLVVEQGLPEGAGSSATALLDLHMLVLLGGRERSRAQLERLLSQAGLSLHSVTRGTQSWLVEARISRARPDPGADT